MILRKGSKGSVVRELQKALGLNTDGIFGPATEVEVKKFQKQWGLTPDGIVGPKTWEMILKEEGVVVTPVYNNDEGDEDHSDPEDEMVIDNVEELQPTCHNVKELINLINKSNITRKVTRLVFHCTATSQSATVEGIMKYWKEKMGWKSPGYHIIVKPDGSWTQLKDFNGITNGVAGINSTTIHVSYIGGIDDSGKAFDNRTDAQNDILETVYQTFKAKMPNLKFFGHYEFSSKACPSYNVENWIKAIESIN